MSLLPPQSVEASSSLQENIEEKIVRIANEHEIAPQLLRNLVECESNFDPKAINETGDRGIVQISSKYHPEVSDKQTFDEDFALNWASEKIAKGESYEWVCSNCYLFATVKLGKLPRMAEIVGNSNFPRLGGVVIIYYGKLKHLAVIEKVTESGVNVIEANYEPNLITRRTLTWDYLERYKATYWHPDP